MNALDTYRTAAKTIRPFSAVKATTVISEAQGDSLVLELHTDHIPADVLLFIAKRGLSIEKTGTRLEDMVVKCSLE